MARKLIFLIAVLLLGLTYRLEGFAICSLSEPLMDDFGSCYACDEKEAIFMGDVKKRCTVCPNRRMTHVNKIGEPKAGYCGLKCPKDKPLIGHFGCYSCNADPDDILPVKENCNVCSKFDSFDKYCLEFQNMYIPAAVSGEKGKLR